MKRTLIAYFFIFFLQQSHARVLHVTVRPAVACVSLHCFNGLKEQVQRFPLTDGKAALPVTIREGLLTISLPSGQQFPLWVAATDTGYTMLLTPASPLPQITGSAITSQLYLGMGEAAKLQLREATLAQTRQGLADTALLAKIIGNAQYQLNLETDSLYRQLQFRMGQVANVLLWGNTILPTEAQRLNGNGMEREAKANIISFVRGHYAVAAKSDLLRNLINQYLLVTEAARIPPGTPRFEDRTRADMGAWTFALQGKRTVPQVTNYIIDYFLHRNMWTLCDTLMKGNADASCAAPTVAQVAMTGKALWQNGKGDSLAMLKAKGPVLLALYDMDCPSAVMEYVLMRRKLGEGYQVPVQTGMVLLHQDVASFAGTWQGMPPAIYHNTGQGYAALAALLPPNARLPSYWILAAGHPRYLGSSYRDVQHYFDKKNKYQQP